MLLAKITKKGQRRRVNRVSEAEREKIEIVSYFDKS